MNKDIDYDLLPVRYILCVDVKSFFASVEAVRRNIDPLEAWIAVVSDLRRPGGVVLASSPKVKKYCNIKTGNRKFEIKDKRVQMVNPSMALYLDYNRRIHEIFKRYAAEEDINVYSIDESFLDVTSTAHLFKNPYNIAKKIKKEIYEELGLHVTIGIGDNPLLAKLALDNAAKKKVSQIAYWPYETIEETIWKIPELRDFWGISRGWEKRFNKLGIYTIKQLANFDKDLLNAKFGIMGLQQYYHANGVDYSRISQPPEFKNEGYSKGQILMRDYDKEEDILIILDEMIEEVVLRLRHHNMTAGGFSIFCGFSSNESSGGFSFSKKFGRQLKDSSIIKKYFKDEFYCYWRGEKVRQFNIGLFGIEEDIGQQISIFEINEEKDHKLDNVIDNIRDRFGLTSVFKGHSLKDSSTFFQRAQYVGGHKGMSEVDNEVEKNQGL